MLLDKINKTYVAIGLALYPFCAMLMVDEPNNLKVTLASFICFLIYAIAIYFCHNKTAKFYNNKHLISIVFVANVLQIATLQLVSYIIAGDTFMFSKRDSFAYYTYALATKDMDLDGFVQYIHNIGWEADDMGAVYWIRLAFMLWPLQQVNTLFNCLASTFMSWMLFSIGRNYMPRRYAFMAALAFSTASFTNVFSSTYAKEMCMTTIIVAAFYFFITHLRKKNYTYLLASIATSLLILFFRTPVFLLLIGTFITTWAYTKLKGAPAIVFTLAFILAVGSTAIYSRVKTQYLRDDNTEAMIERKNKLAQGGGFVNQAADPLAAVAGPFPSVKIRVISKTPFYASGLLYRFLLSGPFFLGLYLIIKERRTQLYPFIIFFMCNALGVAVSVKGLETRLDFPHMAMAYIVAFWFLAMCDYDKIKNVISPKMQNAYLIGIIGLCILWNLRSV